MQVPIEFISVEGQAQKTNPKIRVGVDSAVSFIKETGKSETGC